MIQSAEKEPGRPPEGETKFQTLLESAPVAIVIVNQAGQIELVNAKMEELFGYRAAELVGQTLELLLPEAVRGPHVAYRHGYFVDPRVRPMGVGLDLRGQRKDGSEFPLEIGLSYLETAEGRLAIAFITDITERRRLHGALEAHAAQLEARVQERTYEIGRRRSVAEGLHELLTVLNSDRPLAEILAYIVALASRLLDTDAAALYRLDAARGLLTIEAARGLPDTYVAQASVAVGQGAVGRAVHERQPVTISDVGTLLGGEAEAESVALRALQHELADHFRALLAVPLIVKGEVYGSIVLYYHQPRTLDEEESRLAMAFAAQAALAIENARLRAQVEQTAVAAERTRLARDLHDAVTQTLFSASLIAEVLPRLWQRQPEEGVRRLEELRQLTRGALAEMRTLLYELRPAVLAEIDLGVLLRQLAEATTGRTRVPTQVVVEGSGPLPPEVQVALYRIAQEALNNVVKHAAAHEASAHLQLMEGAEGRRVRLTIRDDGRGFEPAQVAPQRLGLMIMQERAAAIGATLAVHSAPGQGTQVQVRWPGGETDE